MSKPVINVVPGILNLYQAIKPNIGVNTTAVGENTRARTRIYYFAFETDILQVQLNSHLQVQNLPTQHLAESKPLGVKVFRLVSDGTAVGETLAALPWFISPVESIPLLSADESPHEHWTAGGPEVAAARDSLKNRSF